MKVVVVGAGKLGRKLAETMVSENIDVTVIDKKQSEIDEINEHLDVLTVHGNGIDMSILKELRIQDYDLLVACTSNDETSTLICTLAKRLGCKMTIARIRSPEYLKQIEFIKSELGIDHVINPDLATAESIEKYLLKSHSFYSDGFASGRVQMLDFNIGTMTEFVGKKLMELQDFDDILIAAISRDGDIIIPDGKTVLEDFDLIHVIGQTDKIEALSDKFDEKLFDKPIKKVMILGGSNIAFYLAKNLIKSNINVTIIEKEIEVCNTLSEKLNDVLIIHGDATDILLLEEENLEGMDAVIGTTGYDESNLLMGLMAKQQGVRRVVSKISKESYTKVIDRLGIDAALNPIYITSSKILKIIRGGRIQSISLLIGGDGEVTEILLSDKLPIISKTLEELELPKGTIIGALVRGEKVIIPRGDTVLKGNDRIIVFSLKENLRELKMFFRPEKKGGLFGGLWNSSKDIR